MPILITIAALSSADRHDDERLEPQSKVLDTPALAALAATSQ